MPDNREKFQELLRQIFQFDCSDLDFGIYRIMNYKRDAIERFIQKDLLEGVVKELSTGALASQSQVAAELEETADQIREALGDGALNGEGVLAQQYHETRVGKRYLDLQKRAFGTVARPALEAAIFNHLYAFFSRYYDSGDFLSKRRYSRKEKYAIPYNGEEVYLHWANSDQYYVKTGEYFTDYRFKASNGVTVHFRLQQADVPQNNVKGDKRFFIPMAERPALDPKAKELVILFEYRPLNSGEQTKYGQRNQQDTIIGEAVQTIPNRLEDAALLALTALHHRTSDGAEVSFLAHHLRQYTQKNTSDFFIHKDLKGFLSRELDFYLKNEILNLDEMEAAGELRADGWFQIMRVMKAVGGRIIDFLAQIENFQKKLFEKKKFITETQYCITVGNIDGAFYRDIAGCEQQWAEWKELFHIDEEEKHLFNSTAKSRTDRRVAFLKAHPTLVFDTKHFDRDFKDRLLASFDDLDEMTDGLLINSENFQALGLLTEEYRGKVKCIYIDPPYNTDAGPILYKNGYRSSSWVTLIENRLAIARELLMDEGIICITIDDYQVHELGHLLDKLFDRSNQLGVAVIRNNPSGRSTVRGFSICHEYAFFYRHTEGATFRPFPRTEKQLQRFTEENGTHVNWRNFRKDGGAVTYRVERPKQFYPIYVRVEKCTLRIPELIWDRNKREWSTSDEPQKGEVVVWPIDEKGKERVWSLNHTSAQECIADLQVRIGKDGDPEIFRRHTASEGVLPRSWWDNKTYAAREYGSSALAALFGESSTFSFAKSPFAVRDCLWVCGLDNGSSESVLDFFAGSGTTAQAVINLNREDGGQRKFVLVDVEDCFDAVILPRIKKITFSPEWKDTKPVRQATEEEAERSPRIVKYLRLESYEDALNNIRFADAPKTLYDFDDYVIRYMLEWEAKESATLLNIQQLASPFSYRLELGAEREIREKEVDIPETFAYLLGMHVTTRRTHEDKERRYLVYRGRIDHRRIVIIWRETAKWEKADYERDKAFVAEKKLTEGADEVFVNGDSLIPNARSLDSLFKSRMFGGV